MWPGAYIFYKGNRWFNFYIGYGHKHDNEEYYPMMPPLPQTEAEEIPEQSEPKDNQGEDKVDPEAIPGFITILQEIIDDPDKFKKTLNKAFEVFDTENSGELDRKEVRNLLKCLSKQLQIPMGPKPIQEFFKEFDTDKTGLISKEELSDPLRGLLMIWVETFKENQGE